MWKCWDLIVDNKLSLKKHIENYAKQRHTKSIHSENT